MNKMDLFAVGTLCLILVICFIALTGVNPRDDEESDK